MLMIRYQRIGRTNDPAFRIVVLEKERAAKSGHILEQVGTYNPKSKALNLKEDRIQHWISMGAQLTDSIHNLFVTKGIVKGKKINILPAFKAPEVVAEAAPAAAPAPVVEAAPAETPAA